MQAGRPTSTVTAQSVTRFKNEQRCIRVARAGIPPPIVAAGNDQHLRQPAATGPLAISADRDGVG